MFMSYLHISIKSINKTNIIHYTLKKYYDKLNPRKGGRVMKIKDECLYCLVRQLTKLANKLTQDDKRKEEIINYGLEVIRDNYFKETSLFITGIIYEFACNKTCISDPYKEEKKDFNVFANEIIKEFSLRKYLCENYSLDELIRLSIAGNVIDFSLGYDIDKSDLQIAIDESLTANLFGSNSEKFASAIKKANNIMFIGDNAGEIVFDKLLIEKLPKNKITYVVKGGPIVNDVTNEDAKEIELDKMVKVIDTGAAIQGIEFSKCSSIFMESYREADLIVSKGQANYESLSERNDKETFYLLKAKCQVIADDIGCNHNQYVLLHKGE